MTAAARDRAQPAARWKSCACGLAFNRLAWDALPIPAGGDYQSDADGEQVGLQLRQCPGCDSTLACQVLADGAVTP